MSDNGNGNGYDAYYTPQERAALVTFQILDGAQLTTPEIAESVGVSRQAAWRMMQGVSRVVPVYQDGDRWRRMR